MFIIVASIDFWVEVSQNNSEPYNRLRVIAVDGLPAPHGTVNLFRSRATLRLSGGTFFRSGVVDRQQLGQTVVPVYPPLSK
jgi:hypothetical protein